MSNPSDAFHRHLDCCAHCQRHPFDLCAVGQPLLVAAATEPMPPPPPSAVEQVIAEMQQRIENLSHSLVAAIERAIAAEQKLAGLSSPVLVTRMRNEDDEKVTRVDTLSHDVSTARNDRDGQRGTE